MKGIKLSRKHDNELVYFVDMENGKVFVHIEDGTFLEIELDDDDKRLYRQSVSDSVAKSKFETSLRIYTQAWIDCLVADRVFCIPVRDDKAEQTP